MESGKRAIDLAILRLISQHAVHDQASLLALLAEEGFKLTQGTLSRRMARLSVRKRAGRYQRVAISNLPTPAYSLAVSHPNLLILQTAQGQAPALALRMDRTLLKGAAGVVTGDDTLLVAAQTGTPLEELCLQIEEMLGPPQR